MHELDMHYACFCLFKLFIFIGGFSGKEAMKKFTEINKLFETENNVILYFYIVMNLDLPSLYGDSLNITLTVPFNACLICF